MLKIKVTSKGQITLPSDARRKLNIREGDTLDATIRNGSLVLIPRKSERPKGVAESTAGTWNDFEMSGAEFTQSLRKGSGKRLDKLYEGDI